MAACDIRIKTQFPAGIEVAFIDSPRKISAGSPWLHPEQGEN
jgi:hypothetical protein